jgi:hypothetical protein
MAEREGFKNALSSQLVGELCLPAKRRYFRSGRMDIGNAGSDITPSRKFSGLGKSSAHGIFRSTPWSRTGNIGVSTGGMP